MKVEKPDATQSPAEFLESVQGESAFFRALCDIRPVGLHREFHMLAIANHIRQSTRVYVPVADLWTKFETAYNPGVLEGFEKLGYTLGGVMSSSEDEESEDEEMEDEDDEGGENRSTTKRLHARDDPKVGEDLENHPFFRMEFDLPSGHDWPVAVPAPTTTAPAPVVTSGTTGGRGHARKESVAVAASGAGGRTTRGKATKVNPSASTAQAKTTNEEESESDLTDDDGAEEKSKGKDETADADEGDEDETKESATEEQEPEPEQTGTRRSTRHARTATRETNAPPARGTTKKKRG